MNSRELQSLRNLGGLCEEAADDIDLLANKIKKLEEEVKKLKQDVEDCENYRNP